MNIIKQNPFRILGLTGNVTEKELQKQIGIIKRYAEVGKAKTFDCDFEFIGDFLRTSDEIQQASNRIEQAHKKLLYSLFWFVKSNQIDEVAFNNLKEGDTDKAIEIWKRTLKKEITSKNYSSYLNLSTLYIALSTIDDQIEFRKLHAGISLKGDLIHSENFKYFSKLVTGNRVSNSSIKISKIFVDEVIELLKPYLNKRNGISTNDLISLFSTFPTKIQKYISAKFTEIPISSIVNQIEKTTSKRKKNSRDAKKYGEELYYKTNSDIALLKKLMGVSNVQFQMIANKLANEILQCSIDFFNKHRVENNEIDPGEDALKITKYAESIVATGHIKDRIVEAMTSIQEWVDDKPNRERQEAVAGDLAFITNKLQQFQNLSNSIDNSRDLIVSCKPKLINIKNELGIYDDFYLQISSAVAGNAMGMIIEVVNNAQSGLEYNSSKLKLLANIILSAVSTLNQMDSIDMNINMRNSYKVNKQTINNIGLQFKTIDASYSPSRSAGSKNGWILFVLFGAYIWWATIQSSNNKNPTKILDKNYTKAKLSPSYPRVKTPLTGEIRTISNEEFVAPFEIQTSQGTNYLVKLVSKHSQKTVMTVFIKGGNIVSTKAPLGTYEVKYATGDKWYGYKHIFGPSTRYNKAESLFTFKKTGNNVSGYTISLYRVSNGNLRTSTISPSQF